MNISSVLSTFAAFAWVAVIGLILFAVLRASRGKPLKGAASFVVGLLAVSIILTTASLSVVFLEANEYAVVRSAFQPNGYRTTPLNPGLHWIIPFVENVVPYSIAKQTYTMAQSAGEGQVAGDDSIQCRTKDGQQVYIDASVIYSIDPSYLINLHITWQNRYEDNVVRPVVRAVIRDAVSQFGVEEIVSSKRAELEAMISQGIEQGMQQNNLIMNDFLLRNIRFSDEYAVAVEQKQIAEQQALQAQFVVQQKKQEAEQARQTAQGQADAAVIAAQGDAKAILLKAQAQAEAWAALAEVLNSNPEMLTYEYIQKIAPNLQVIYLPSGTPLLLPSVNPSDVLPAAAPTTTP